MKERDLWSERPVYPSILIDSIYPAVFGPVKRKSSLAFVKKICFFMKGKISCKGVPIFPYVFQVVLNHLISHIVPVLSVVFL